jgi:hypothetical protein
MHSNSGTVGGPSCCGSRMQLSQRRRPASICQPAAVPVGFWRIHSSRLEIRPPSILRARCRQIATMRMPPKSITRSPTLNSPSRAWSARNGSRVFDVAARHIGLTGCIVEGIPTTGIAPALAVVTRPFSISPQSTSRTPARTHADRTARSISHRIAQDSHSQITGCCVHAN